MKTSALLAALVLLLAAPRADAQQLQLQIENGLVTLNAQNVSVRQILAEWSRVGTTRIVNGDKVIGGPVTLQLTGVPERQALDTILRGVSGYMLASRQASGTGLSSFDRILILPTSSAPRTAAMPPAPAFGGRPNPMPQPVPVQQMPEAQPELVADEDQDPPMDGGDPEPGDEPVEEEVVVAPGPAMAQPVQRGGNFPNPMGGQFQPYPQPYTTAPGGYPGAPVTAQPVDDEAVVNAPTPSPTPFNVPPGASATPGVIAPVPQQEPTVQPVMRTRPPRPPV